MEKSKIPLAFLYGLCDYSIGSLNDTPPVGEKTATGTADGERLRQGPFTGPGEQHDQSPLFTPPNPTTNPQRWNRQTIAEQIRPQEGQEKTTMLFLVAVKEAYKANSVYLIGLDKKEDATDPDKVKRAILKSGTTYQSKVDGQPDILSIISAEPHKDEEQDLRDRLKVIRDFKRKTAETNKASQPAETATKKTAKK